MRGPYESDARAYWIAERVRALGGHYVLPMSEFDPFPDTDLPEYGNYPETDVIESDQYPEPDVIDAPWRALESGAEEPDKGEGPSADEGRHGVKLARRASVRHSEPRSPQAAGLMPKTAAIPCLPRGLATGREFRGDFAEM